VFFKIMAGVGWLCFFLCLFFCFKFRKKYKKEVEKITQEREKYLFVLQNHALDDD